MSLREKAKSFWRKQWKKPWLKRCFYNAVAFTQRKSEDSMLNCGFVGELEAEFPENLVGKSHERSSYVLYWKVLEKYLKDGHDLLEIGCGRGGGLHFLSRWRQLGRVVGIDFAGALIRQCRSRFGLSGIEFRRADALSLPFPDESFDVAVSLELSHSIEDKDRFLNETLRVLRPGGLFVWVDFVYERTTAMHSFEKCELAINRCTAECIEKVDMTENALASLNASSDERIARIEASVWKPMQRLAKDFAVTKGSSLYRCLEEKRGRYWMFVLKK